MSEIDSSDAKRETDEILTVTKCTLIPATGCLMCSQVLCQLHLLQCYIRAQATHKVVLVVRWLTWLCVEPVYSPVGHHARGGLYRNVVECGSPVRQCFLHRVCGRRVRPDMPRCIISTCPSSRWMTIYFARRSIRSTVRPASFSPIFSGNGNRKSGRRAVAEMITRPSSTCRRPAQTVSTSGSSGIFGLTRPCVGRNPDHHMVLMVMPGRLE